MMPSESFCGVGDSVAVPVVVDGEIFGFLSPSLANVVAEEIRLKKMDSKSGVLPTSEIALVSSHDGAYSRIFSE
tara:strand:- start:851 stop:1072 length:222 start_codon:yes stop_codon:yes gene_type:complete